MDKYSIAALGVTGLIVLLIVATIIGAIFDPGWLEKEITPQEQCENSGGIPLFRERCIKGCHFEFYGCEK